MSNQSDMLIPLALLGLGAYFVLRETGSGATSLKQQAVDALANKIVNEDVRNRYQNEERKLLGSLSQPRTPRTAPPTPVDDRSTINQLTDWVVGVSPSAKGRTWFDRLFGP